MAEINIQETMNPNTATEVETKKGLFAGIILSILLIALFFDLKYKGLFYRYFLPESVQSFADQRFGAR
ncbi:hypothetical protein [Oceanobacillus sp. FSL H7-0719]|uniref:hypothetical protein n=1 Tax=Oceanobacillus sp. FSL H7-0719 TaxID=2954507 RepID=UPI00325376EE